MKSMAFAKIDELKNYDGEIDNIFMKEIYGKAQGQIIAKFTITAPFLNAKLWLFLCVY